MLYGGFMLSTVVLGYRQVACGTVCGYRHVACGERQYVPTGCWAAQKQKAPKGQHWRLPSADELKNIVCKACAPPKIDLQLFPATSAEPYWTGEANPHRKPNIYSINFYTGHKYGNFFPYQRLAVRLVRDR